MKGESLNWNIGSPPNFGGLLFININVILEVSTSRFRFSSFLVKTKISARVLRQARMRG
jgi:hypothetical protein